MKRAYRSYLVGVLESIENKLGNAIDLNRKIPNCDTVAEASYRAGFVEHEITSTKQALRDLLIDDLKKADVENDEVKS